jgi:phage/plasmid primase-like uncharacterized protein
MGEKDSELLVKGDERGDSSSLQIANQDGDKRDNERRVRNRYP